jgi:hypothetical protein
MAIYYVRTDGNDLNAGSGPAVNQAWQTIGKALGAMGIGSGDTLYIAPGVYRQASTVNLGGTYNSMTYIYGDPTASQFSGVNSGQIRITAFSPNDYNVGSSITVLNPNSKSNFTISNITFESGNATPFSGSIVDNVIIDKCKFTAYRGSAANSQHCLRINSGSITQGLTIKNSIFVGGSCGVVFTPVTTGTNPVNFLLQNCLIYGQSFDGIHIGYPDNLFSGTFGIGNKIYQNTVMFSGRYGIYYSSGTQSSGSFINNIFLACGTGIGNANGGTGVENFNRIVGCPVSRAGSNTGANSTTDGSYGLDFGDSLLFGLASQLQMGSQLGGTVYGVGTTSGMPTADLYGNTWASGTNDIGSTTYKINATIATVYTPSERNTSTMTIAPGSTSQSIELYLGATGLTYQTSGLRAYYVRNRSTPVQITLVNQTNNGAWNSGGFAEIDPVNMPGLYRIDVPNAAFASGSSDVTINVRGAAGTNGAVLTVNLAYTQVDMTQSVPTSNTAHTIGDALNAARAYGFGKWVISGTTLSLYASDNTTVIKTFTLDSGSYPTSRT